MHWLSRSVTPHVRDLGTHLSGSRGGCASTLNDRARGVCKYVQAIGGLPASAADKERLVASKALSAALFGVTTAKVNAHVLETLRGCVKKCLFGDAGRHVASPEIVFTLIHRGFRVDPFQAEAVHRLHAVRRMLAILPACQALWRQVWAHYHELAGRPAADELRRESALSKVHVPGPVALAQQTLHKFGWDARDPLHWRIRREPSIAEQHVPEVHVLDTPLPLWLHWLREGARRWRWTVAGQKQRGILHTIWVGAVPTQDLLFRQKTAASSSCPHCQGDVAETSKHRHWHCPAWAAIRSAHGFGPDEVDVQALPLCLRTCGVCPQSEDADRVATLPVQRDVDPDMPHIDDVWLTVYTDGAATRAKPDNAAPQRAGYAMVNDTLGTIVVEPFALEGQTALWRSCVASSVPCLSQVGLTSSMTVVTVCVQSHVFLLKIFLARSLF